MRTVKTTSGATAVQVVWSSRRGSREIEHLGSAHDEGALKAAARQLMAAGQVELARPGPGARGWRAAADHVLADGAPAGRPGARLPDAGLQDAAGGDDVPALGAGPDHRAGEQARQPAGP
jgi:hypothetical protein